MKVVIYCVNSFGGNYDYALQLHRAYLAHPDVERCILILPNNAAIESDVNVLKVLMKDKSTFKNRLLQKFYFLLRSILNPFILLKVINRAKASCIIFNDFDQATVPLWAPFFEFYKRKTIFSIIVHDPDRDAYFALKGVSQFTMKLVTGMMDIIFYHGTLPNKAYYDGKFLKTKIPHGIYPQSIPDDDFYNYLVDARGTSKFIGVLGNIRDEKNYELIITALTYLPNCKLLVAGKPSNSDVPINAYQKLISDLNLKDRVVWIQRYLSPAEMSAAILACDVISIYYKPSFASQSGILNSIAPYKKPIIVANTRSALTETVSTYGLGELIPPDSPGEFIKAVTRLLETPKNDALSWDRYLKGCSWDEHVYIAMAAFSKLKHLANAN